MSVVIHPDPLIPQLVQALGLDPTRVRSLRLNFAVNDIVTADVTEYVEPSQLDKFVGVCTQERQYVLVPADSGRWIPVSERLPEPRASEWEDGVPVLGWSKSNGRGIAHYVFNQDYGNRWSWECVGDPTHWMPLPEPPVHS